MVDHPSAELLASYVLQTITDEEREYIDHHLLRCAACRAHLSKHEAGVRRIRYELTADLRQEAALSRSNFSQVAERVNRPRQWGGWDRALAVAPRVALWAAILAILFLIIQFPLQSGPRPAATDATFENRELQLFTEQPGLEVGPPGAWDSWSIYPSKALFYDGQFHMLYSSKSIREQTLAIGYATSPDGLNWTRQTTEPVLRPDATGLPEATHHIIANSLLVEDGQWTMYFTASQYISLLAGQIFRATAPSPLGPWTVDAQPVLVPGTKGEWDSTVVDAACVSQVESGYVMYYAGGTPHRMIGRAISTDGVTWTKYNDPATNEAPLIESDPVLVADQKWEANLIDYGCAQLSAGRWVMTYSSGDTKSIGYAVSADGITWHKSPQNPIIRVDDLGNRDPVLATTLMIHEQTAFLYFQPYLASVQRGLLVATWREP